MKGRVTTIARKFGVAVKLDTSDRWLSVAHGYMDMVTDDWRGKDVEIRLNGNGHIIEIKETTGQSASPSGMPPSKDVQITRQVAVKAAAELCKMDLTKDFNMVEVERFFRLSLAIEQWINRER